MLGHRELTMEDYAGHLEAAILADLGFCDPLSGGRYL